VAKPLKQGLESGPGTTMPGPDVVGHRPSLGAVSARGPPLLADYLPERDAAEELRQSLRTLRSWRQKRVGPSWIKVGKLIFYGRNGLNSWLTSLEQKPVRAKRAR
jgi:hypothetical protein